MDSLTVEPRLESSFTELYYKASGGDRGAANLLYQMAGPRLRHIAWRLLHRYRTHSTLQPTALISEVYIKLRGFGLRIAGREHFYRISARAMRQILADRAERQQRRAVREMESAMRGEENMAEDFESAQAVKMAFATFARIDADAARVLWLRHVEGETWPGIARKMGQAEWRVREDAEFALGWLRENLT